MGEKKYLDYTGLQTYHENLQLVIEGNEEAISVALEDLDDRLKAVEDKDPYSKDDIDNIIEPITSKLENIEDFAEVNVQSDWNQTDTSADDYIKNKPTIPSPYTLPIASANTLGGVKIGDGLSIDNNGVLSAEEQEVEIGETSPIDNNVKLFVDTNLEGTIFDVYTKSQVDAKLVPEKLGFGIGTCTTAAATAAKEVSITGYQLIPNGYVSVTFENSVPANATLSINSLGAKPIIFKGEAIVANVINAGDTVTFVYDSTNYVIACPINLSKITIRCYSDAQKTTPAADILYVTHPDGTTEQVRVGSTGVKDIYGKDGNYSVSSLVSDLDIHSFTINGDTTIDIVVTNTTFVDLGLPSGTLWAVGNICKDSNGVYSMGNPEDYGAYFSWGNIDGYYWNSNSDKEAYDFSDANYNSSPGKQVTANIASNDAEHDAAVARLGGDWHMPTKEDFQELLNTAYTTVSAMTISGIDGKLITSISNGNTLFLPSPGYRYVTTIASQGNYNLYWSSSYVNTGAAYHSTGNPVSPINSHTKRDGMAIRAVL